MRESIESLIRAGFRYALMAGFLALFLAVLWPAPVKSYPLGISTGANWVGASAVAFASVDSKVNPTGVAPGLGKCYVLIQNETATPLYTGYSNATIANGVAICDGCAAGKVFIRDAAATAVFFGGVVLAGVRIEVGGGCY